MGYPFIQMPPYYNRRIPQF